MSEQIVEYLYFSKKELENSIQDTFKKAISPFIVDSKLHCVIKEKRLTFEFDITPFNNSLHVSFRYNKVGRMTISEIDAFQQTLKNINIEASKLYLKTTTLLDTNSLFFSKKILPYLHSYEWAIRKLIYLVLPSHFSNKRVEDLISEEVHKGIKGKSRNTFKSENILMWMDLAEIEEYLFGENYIYVTQDKESSIMKFKSDDFNSILELYYGEQIVLSKPYSLWTEIFNEYIRVDSEEVYSDMTKIREIRNKVSHNKDIILCDYKIMLSKLKKYINYLEDAFKRILGGDIEDEYLDIMSNDLEDYIQSNIIKTHFSNIPQIVDLTSNIQSNIIKPYLSNIHQVTDLTSNIQSNIIKPYLSNIHQITDLISNIQSNIMKPYINNMNNFPKITSITPSKDTESKTDNSD